MKKILSLAMTVIMVLSLGCNIFAAPATQTFSDSKYKIEFQIDKTWKKQQNTGSMMRAFYMKDPANGSSLNLQVEAPAINVTLEKYMSLAISQLKSAMAVKNVKVTYSKGTNKKIKVAVLTENMDKNGVPLKLYQYIFKYNGKFYILTFGAVESNYSKDLKVMEQLIKSIKLK